MRVLRYRLLVPPPPARVRWQTGGLSRDIERGTSGISFLMRFMVFNIVPTLVEAEDIIEMEAIERELGF